MVYLVITFRTEQVITEFDVFHDFRITLVYHGLYNIRFIIRIGSRTILIGILITGSPW